MFKQLKEKINANLLAFVIFVVIVVAALFVMVSVMIYVKSGDINLDLSRPGFEDVRKSVIVDDSQLPGYAPDGPINEQAVDDFLKLFDNGRKTVSNSGDFDDEVLSDKTLDLVQ